MRLASTDVCRMYSPKVIRQIESESSLSTLSNDLCMASDCNK